MWNLPRLGICATREILSCILNCILQSELKGQTLIYIVFHYFSLPLKTGNNLGGFVCFSGRKWLSLKKSWRIKVKFTDIQGQRLKRLRKLWKVKAQFCCLRHYFHLHSRKCLNRESGSLDSVLPLMPCVTARPSLDLLMPIIYHFMLLR